MNTKHTIINGDSCQMSELANKSVHLIVTSPPYWQLKDYGADNQIGFNDSYENNLMAYLYLENKTFVNAHLLKEKLVDVDDAVDFKYKSKFLGL
jgi:DNA modification methylase